ncbi:MAG: type II toxin-antitoxin system VapC family toxin [Acidimicrobiia bacterium]|nr:type II toxin-antitoxin system VapC family toxin [Acidimicrobiia bacterium]
MKRLFDSTVLIAHLRGVTAATDLLLTAVERGEAVASVLSRTEIEGGMRSGERTDVARLFTALTMEPVTDAIAASAGALLREFRRSHSGIDVVDYVVAATALEVGAQLLTLNVRHFPMFDNLEAAF